MVTQRMAQGSRRTLVKQNLHGTPLCSFEAALRVVENSVYLRALDSREPVQKLVDSGATFDVFEERFHRDASVLEKPSTADFSGDPFNRRALCPVNHGYKMVNFRSECKSVSAS